jgi:hypothetical protein
VSFAGIYDFSNTTGFYDPGDYTSVGFVGKRDGSYFSFEMPGSCQGCTFPGAINSVGQIAGQYYDEYYNLHGFIRNPNGEFKTLDFPNASNGSGVYSINNWGAITGVYCGLNEWGDCQNFVAIGSQFVPVWSIEADQAGTSLTLNSINDAGQVVAYYLDATNSYHSFVGTPVLPLHSTVH